MGSIDDISELCRLCLVKDQVNIPIFDETSDIRQTFLKINSCLPVKVSRDDNLPKKICDGCSYKLDMLYIFRNTSVDSEKQLISWLNQAGLSSCALSQSAAKDPLANAKPEIMVKQETFETTESRVEGDSPEMGVDAHSYIIQQQKLPYPQEFAFAEASGSTAGLMNEEPAPKRAKRAAAMKKPPLETEEDDLDVAMQITKAEDEDSDDADQPDYVEAPSTSADDQPGPSGVGKGTIEAPESDYDEVYTPPEILRAAKTTSINLLSESSRKCYSRTYEAFMEWSNIHMVNSFSENVLLAYFKQLSEKYKSPTLWKIYSMLRSTLNINNEINIEKYSKLRHFLKRRGYGYQPKKCKTFTPQEINRFITEAPDKIYLATKVALIMGIMGACRSKEMHAMKLEDIQDLEKAFLITIPNTKTNSVRQFTVTGSFHKICKKYADLRPANVTTSSFFLNYQHGRCTPQKIGINKFGLMGKQIATYLNLPNANLYTGHCFRRSSATMPADIGGYDGSQTTTNKFI